MGASSYSNLLAKLKQQAKQNSPWYKRLFGIEDHSAEIAANDELSKYVQTVASAIVARRKNSEGGNIELAAGLSARGTEGLGLDFNAKNNVGLRKALQKFIRDKSDSRFDPLGPSRGLKYRAAQWLDKNYNPLLYEEFYDNEDGTPGYSAQYPYSGLGLKEKEGESFADALKAALKRKAVIRLDFDPKADYWLDAIPDDKLGAGVE